MSLVGTRSMLLGDGMMSGFLKFRFTWRRRRWNICAPVVGFTTCMLSLEHNCRKRSIRQELCTGPAPSYPCGNKTTSPDQRSHLISLLARY